MLARLEPPVEAEGLAVRAGLGVRVDFDLQLLVAEDLESLFADEPETLSPLGELLADEPLDAPDIVDTPGAGSLPIGEAGAVGHGGETE